MKNLWLGYSMEHCLKTEFSKEELKDVRYFPLHFLWFIWKARNQIFLEDHLPLPIQVSIQSLGVLRSIPHDLIFIKTRLVVEETIDKTFAWGYFDGSTLGNMRTCATGGLIYFYEDQFVTFKARLGIGTNNFAKLFGLKLLLRMH